MGQPREIQGTQKRDASSTSQLREFPSSITIEEYFGAARGGRFRDPNLPPTEESLRKLLNALSANDEQARRLGTCNYFQFSGSDAAL